MMVRLCRDVEVSSCAAAIEVGGAGNSMRSRAANNKAVSSSKEFLRANNNV